MELTILWQCPKCGNYQNRLIRFKNDEEVDDNKVVHRKRKARFTCIYCGKVSKLEDLPFHKTLYPEESRVSAKLNEDREEENLRF